MSDEEAGGRIFFSSIRRSLEIEDEIRLVSVGVDIGSSTSHLVFSRLVLERLDNRYVVAEREIIFASDVLLTPYADDFTIDAAALGAFIDRQYKLAGIDPASIDTGALILTGVAVRRSNARAIGELFATQAGKFVSVSAGDALEATLAAFGSGAAARSIRDAARVMNVDIGGGTSKIGVCEEGAVVEFTALDVGARLISFDGERRVVRVEEPARRFAKELGMSIAVGDTLNDEVLDGLVNLMADRLFEAMSSQSVSPATESVLRLEPLRHTRRPDVLMFSGGVSEYIDGRERQSFGDLGARLAEAVRERVTSWGPQLERGEQGIRATVVGASQYTIQVSGSTIFVHPLDTLPLRNVPVVMPDIAFANETLDAATIAQSVRQALKRLDLAAAEHAVAVCYRWQGSATYARLDAFARGVVEGVDQILERGFPLVLVGDGDVGGLIGIHVAEDLRLANAIVSIDGVSLKEFDFIDIGAMLELSGAVPVVIKSLVFPSTAAVGRA